MLTQPTEVADPSQRVPCDDGWAALEASLPQPTQRRCAERWLFKCLSLFFLFYCPLKWNLKHFSGVLIQKTARGSGRNRAEGVKSPGGKREWAWWGQIKQRRRLYGSPLPLRTKQLWDKRGRDGRKFVHFSHCKAERSNSLFMKDNKEDTWTQ